MTEPKGFQACWSDPRPTISDVCLSTVSLPPLSPSPWSLSLVPLPGPSPSPSLSLSLSSCSLRIQSRIKSCQMLHHLWTQPVSKRRQPSAEAPALWSLPSIEDITLEAVQNKLILQCSLPGRVIHAIKLNPSCWMVSGFCAANRTTK